MSNIKSVSKHDKRLPEIEEVLPKVLVIAYGCEPFASSEPGVGWNFTREIAKFSRVWVVTRSNNQPIIEKAIIDESSQIKNRVEWIYVDLNSWFARLKNRIPFGVQIYYSLWQWKALFICRRTRRSVKFDLAHHLTYGINWLSPAIALLGIRFIWGPIGGGDLVPRAILKREAFSIKIQENIYKVLSRWLPYVSPLAWFTRKRASAILFRTRSAERFYPATPNSRRYIISETAMPEKGHSIEHKDNGYIRAIVVGRMEYWKGFRYAVEGFHAFLNNGGNGELTLLGSGPGYEMIHQYCSKHGLESKIKMPGRVPPEQVQMTLSKSNVLIHPSFRDGGSWAVLEAMTNGLPVICLNASGLADMVDEKSGIIIEAVTPEELVSGIANALMQLFKNTDLRKVLGKGARKRVNTHYRWPQRGQKLQEIYHDILAAD